MDTTIEIQIDGQPSRVTHQSGTRYSKFGTYKTKNLKEWEKQLEADLKGSVPDKPLDGPILLHTAWMFRPSDKRKDGIWKTTKPDADNMVKTLKDVMTRLGFWHDDAQIVCESTTKQWCMMPGIYILVKQLEERV